jgi:photosystem II stability/assembly factor-like uncharacterized protein
MAFDPTNPQIIYVGTGEAHGSADSYYGVGILKTTDGGATWTQYGADTFSNMGISSIIVNPLTPTIVYAALADWTKNSKPLLFDPGIYESVDGGVTWVAVDNHCLGTCANATSLVMDPNNPLILDAGYSGLGVLKTTNGGISWTQKFVASSSNYRVQVAIGGSSSQVLYAGADTNGSGGGGQVFKSTDFGETYLATTAFPNGSYCGGQCWYDNVVAVSPASSNIVMAGGAALYSPVNGIDGTIFLTTNGGTTWTYNDGTVISTTLHPDLHAIAFAPSNPNIVWIGNDGGVYRSTDGGGHWQNRNTNLATLQFQSVAQHPTNPGIVFGGLQDNAKAKTTNYGASWTGLDVGDGGSVAIDPFNQIYWYGSRFSSSGSYMQFQRNDHAGSAAYNDWPVRASGINLNDRVLFYAPLTADPNLTGTVYWGTQRLYKSTDRGNNWSPISLDLTSGGSRSAISKIAVLRGSPNVILVGTSDGNVQITSNGGTNWTDLTKSPLPNRFVSDVAMFDANHLYVAYAGFDGNTFLTPGHVFMSSDGGATWAEISQSGMLGGIPDIQALSLALDPSAAGTLYVGTDFGVYQTTDNGTTWALFNAGLPLVAVFQLSLQSYTGGVKVLAAATHGRGIYRISLGAPFLTPRTYIPSVLK